MAGLVLAVDFGSSNTAAAYRDTQGRIHEVRLSSTGALMPSAVLWSPQRVLVGPSAVQAMLSDPEGFEPSPKRRLADGEILLGDALVPVVDLVAAVLREVFSRAARIMGGPPERLVLTHPDKWSAGQQQQLSDAAVAAGMARERITLVSEATAAAQFYSATGAALPVGARVAVCDFGAGTVDVAVLDKQPDGGFAVVAADGVDGLGGRDLDARIHGWVRRQLAADDPMLAAEVDSPLHLATRLSLNDRIRDAKETLSEATSTSIVVTGAGTARSLQLTRDEFDALIAADVGRAEELTRRVLADANAIRSTTAPPTIYLAGGSSAIPLIHSRLAELGIIATLGDPKTVVCQGALHGRPKAELRPMERPPSPTPPQPVAPPPPKPVAVPPRPVQAPLPQPVAPLQSAPPSRPSMPVQPMQPALADVANPSAGGEAAKASSTPRLYRIAGALHIAFIVAIIVVSYVEALHWPGATDSKFLLYLAGYKGDRWTDIWELDAPYLVLAAAWFAIAVGSRKSDQPSSVVAWVVASLSAAMPLAAYYDGLDDWQSALPIKLRAAVFAAIVAFGLVAARRGSRLDRVTGMFAVGAGTIGLAAHLAFVFDAFDEYSSSGFFIVNVCWLLAVAIYGARLMRPLPARFQDRRILIPAAAVIVIAVCVVVGTKFVDYSRQNAENAESARLVTEIKAILPQASDCTGGGVSGYAFLTCDVTDDLGSESSLSYDVRRADVAEREFEAYQNRMTPCPGTSSSPSRWSSSIGASDFDGQVYCIARGDAADKDVSFVEWLIDAPELEGMKISGSVQAADVDVEALLAWWRTAYGNPQLT